ncbi:MAG: nitrophenyl compound nitroreductase subunit ArsF family protein [Bacteroidales bacterium]
MKKLGLLMLASFLLTGALFTEPAAAGKNEPAQQVKKATPTEVYYFHFTRRCATCQTVEKVAEQAVNEFFPEAMKRGDVTFKSVNIEEKENEDLVKRLKVEGQALLIVNGKDQINITDKGFMYAVNEPDKLKAEIKANVEKFVK